MPVIQKKFFSLEDLKEIFEKSLSKQDVATKLGFTYSNGKVYKKIDKLCIEYNLSMDHFDPFLSQKLNTKYLTIEKTCPVCGVLFKTQLNHRDEKTTCSNKCSNIYFAPSKHTELSNLKRSLKLSKEPFIGPIQQRLRLKKSSNDIEYVIVKVKSKYEHICEFCGNKWFSVKKNSRFCSVQCVADYKSQNNLHKGWASRSKLKPSYAEQYVINLLDELKITNITREYKVSKWFIDFADVERKLALEIDGKQHELPERKSSDEVKDQYLKNESWTILRVKWKKITKEFREELIKNINSLFGEV
jgi:very-short-patch-repair endonuclease